MLHEITITMIISYTDLPFIFIYSMYLSSMMVTTTTTHYFCRAGELNSDELERIVTILQNPTQFKIPTWFLNRQKDAVDGKYSQVRCSCLFLLCKSSTLTNMFLLSQILSNQLDSKMREDLERLKRIRNHRGLRHYWGIKVRGQHTKTTGRRGKTVGVSKKK